MLIKRIAPVSAGKLLAVLYALLGLLIGAFVSIFALLGGLAGGAEAAGGQLAMIGGMLSIVWMPLFYGIVGFIGGLIGALLFNLAASLAGGLQVDVD
jgi:hypothetical protein